MPENWRDKFFNSPSAPFSLAIIAPCLFLWGHNLHMYQLKQIAVCSAFILILACLVYAAIHFLCKIRLPGRLKNIRDILLALAFAWIFCFFLRTMTSPILTKEQNVIFGFVVAGIYWVVFLFNKFRPVNIFLAVLSLLFIVTGAFRAVSDLQESPLDLKTYSYALQSTPNIYLYILESYHDFSTMRQVYGIDTTELENFLETNKFVVYEDALSNSPSTLLSLGDVFSMQLGSGQPKGLDDSTTTTRLIIAGHDGNLLLKNLKENGYHTEYILKGNTYYAAGAKGPFLDKIDVHPFAALLRPLIDINAKFRKIEKGMHHALAVQAEESWQQAVLRFVDEKPIAKSPRFLFFKDGGATHTPAHRPYSWREKDEWVAGRTYQNSVKKSSQEELRPIVEHIIKNDPESVIILLGDHGSRRLRFLWWNDERTLEEFEAKVRSNGETLDSLVKDMFGIFIAVRMPGGGRQDISNGHHLSQANLFRHIFAALNEDPAILNDRVPSESKFNGVTVARDGKIKFEK